MWAALWATAANRTVAVAGVGRGPRRRTQRVRRRSRRGEEQSRPVDRSACLITRRLPDPVVRVRRSRHLAVRLPRRRPRTGDRCVPLGASSTRRGHTGRRRSRPSSEGRPGWSPFRPAVGPQSAGPCRRTGMRLPGSMCAISMQLEGSWPSQAANHEPIRPEVGGATRRSSAITRRACSTARRYSGGRSMRSTATRPP